MLAAGCTDDGMSARMNGGPRHLYQEAQDILSFENHEQWGAPMANSDDHTHGARSAIVNVNGWTEVVSVPLSTIGASGAEATIDIKVPFVQQYWGEVRLIAKIPSQNEWYRELGSQSLIGMTPDAFHTLTFNIPSDLQAKFGNAYSDLTFTVIINAAAGAYLLDNLQLGQDAGDTETAPVDTDTGSAGSDTDSVLGEVYSVRIQTPNTVPFEDVVLGSATSLTIGADTTISPVWQGIAVSTALGLTGTRMVEPDAEVGDIWSGGNVDIGDRVTVHGSIYSPTTVIGNDVVVEGDTVTNLSVEPVSEIKWNVVFPFTQGEQIWLEPNQSASPAPGYYSTMRIGPTASITLTTGIYHIDVLTVEDSASVVLDQTEGPIILYVRDQVIMRGTITVSDDSISDLLIVYLGDQEMHLERAFQGTVVAANAGLTLHPASYTGAFFAESITVQANATIHHIPAWSLLRVGAGDVEDCVSHIQPRTTLTGRAAEVAYQKDMLRYCVAPDMDSCYALLVSRAQVDRTTAALQFLNREISSDQYLGMCRDRTRKLSAARKDNAFALSLCMDDDADGDWVVDARDNCAATPALMPTDDAGCTSALPPTPPDEDIHQLLSEMNIIASSACRAKSLPGIGFPGGFFWIPVPNVVYVVFAEGSRNGDSTDCPLSYEFELSGETRDYQPAHLHIVFRESERTYDLLNSGKPVPKGLIQFVVTDTDGGDRTKTGYESEAAQSALPGAGIQREWNDQSVERMEADYSERLSVTWIQVRHSGGLTS